MPTKVLIIDNAVHRFLFKPSWHWKAHLKDIDTETVNLPSGRAIPSLGAFSHITFQNPIHDATDSIINEGVAGHSAYVPAEKSQG